MYTVLYSNDPFLLARMAVDLQMEGFYNDDGWNDTYNPFTGALYLDFAVNNQFTFFEINFVPKSTLTLTESNYIETLGFLIENKSKK